MELLLSVVPKGTSVSEGKRVAPEGTSISEWKCVVGLDIGPSTIACVGEDTAFLEAFCPEIERNEKAIRRIQRKLDRTRRATNPDCYNPDGTSKRGVHPKVRSNRYIRLQGELAELKRREAATRKTAHGRLANRIIALGNIVKTEKISYRAWQRVFGKVFPNARLAR